MRKIYFVWLAILAFLMFGCRQDHFPKHGNHSNSGKFHLTKKIVSLDKALHNTTIAPMLADAQNKLKNMSAKLARRSNTEDVLTLDTETSSIWKTAPTTTLTPFV